MTPVPKSTLSTPTRWLLVGMFALLVGLSFFARHLAGGALLGANYNALVFNVNAIPAKTPSPFLQRPNNLLWDETLAYARYAQQMARGDWFGNTFQSYARFAQAGSTATTPTHYPFFFDRSGIVILTGLAALTRDVSRAFALADFLFPLLVAICAVLFCLQLRPSLAFAFLASAAFIWFNWSDSVTWFAALRDSSVDDGMLLSRTPYPQFALVTFLIFGMAFVRAQRTPTWQWSIVLALTLALNAFTYIYSWILAFAVTGVPIVLFILSKPLRLNVSRNFVFACVGTLAAAFVLSAPVWAAYLLSRDVARDVVLRFAAQEVSMPGLVSRTLVLIAFALPLLLPWFQHMTSRVFWLAFWLGSIAAYNQHLITGIMVQPGHYPPYYFGTFALIYLLDLALAILERITPTLFKSVITRILPIVAALVVIVGFGAITWRMVTLARTQMDSNRTNANFTELLSTLNNQEGDYIVLTTDAYLSALLPAYVKQPFVLPLFTDPLTNDEIATVQNAAARVLGYADWNAYSKNKPSPNLPKSAWEFNADTVILVVNRHRPGNMPTKFSKTLLENQDYIVGIAPIQ